MEPTITDWMQSIAACIAIPGAIAGFILLFRKDKDKQEQINKLSGIVDKIEAQNEIMKEANRLSSEQVDIMRSSMVLNKRDDDASKKLLAIEEKKLKLSVKPILKANSGNASPEMFTIEIINLGERAFINEINVLEGNIRQHFPLPYTLEKGNIYYLRGIPTTGESANSIVFRLEIIYADSLENRYRVELAGRGISAKLTEAVEIS